MKTVLLLVPDLMFATKIEEAARHAGLTTASAHVNEDFELKIAEVRPALVLLTFERTGEAWERLAAIAHRARVRVVAFGSHRNVAAFKRAKEIGCDDVVANSRLNAELTQLLRKWVGEDSALAKQ